MSAVKILLNKTRRPKKESQGDKFRLLNYLLVAVEGEGHNQIRQLITWLRAPIGYFQMKKRLSLSRQTFFFYFVDVNVWMFGFFNVNALMLNDLVWRGAKRHWAAAVISHTRWFRTSSFTECLYRVWTQACSEYNISYSCIRWSTSAMRLLFISVPCVNRIGWMAPRTRQHQLLSPFLRLPLPPSLTLDDSPSLSRPPQQRQ